MTTQKEYLAKPIDTLEGVELDIHVAKALGYSFYLETRGKDKACVMSKDTKPWEKVRYMYQEQEKQRYEEVSDIKTIVSYGFWGSGISRYSTCWASGGDLIEQYKISLLATPDGWSASLGGQSATGPTALVAAMRCLIKSSTITN